MRSYKSEGNTGQAEKCLSPCFPDFTVPCATACGATTLAVATQYPDQPTSAIAWPAAAAAAAAGTTPLAIAPSQVTVEVVTVGVIPPSVEDPRSTEAQWAFLGAPTLARSDAE